MADITSTLPPEQRPTMASVDTSLPYKNVQAAVRMFAEKSACQSNKKQYDERKERVNVSSELSVMRKAIEQMHSVSGNHSPEDSFPDLVTELKVTEQKYASVLEELNEMKARMNRLEQELSIALQEKENAQRKAEDALVVAEVNAKRAEELSKEISGTKESLLLVKMACVETNKDREALWAARKVESETSGPSLGSPNRFDEPHQKIQATRMETATNNSRMVRHYILLAREALGRIDNVKGGCRISLVDASTAIELERVKSELSKALDTCVETEATLEDFQSKLDLAKQDLDTTRSELDVIRIELAKTKDREASASLEMLSLKSELEKVNNELKSAVSLNAAFMGLSQKLQKESTQEEEDLTCKFSDDAKAELHALLKQEAEALRKAELCRKTLQDPFLEEKKEILDTLYEDNSMMALQESSLNLPPDSHEQRPTPFSSEMRNSYKEDHRKKKHSLLSFSGLLSRSKRKS
ncbi:hypothetical protein KP509_03G092400 [Ceratopteris richardii]|nr:hypothetical protein KP509_03G092400 [Ceratopteris richardii]KAH7442525.1 hypothetical protein KP509_03G092400 [Ceratopteris richardii]